MIYIEVVAIAIALFIILRFIPSFFPVLISKRKGRRVFQRFFPFVEIVLWLVYIFWAVDQLFKGIAAYPMVTGSLIIVIVAIFGWYFLRDLVCGIILKAENSFEQGQIIHSSAGSGVIKKLSYRSMEIVTENGENVIIPYSLLSSQNIVKPADTGNWAEHIINLRILSSSYQPEKIQALLKQRILEMPWIVSDDNINLEIAKEDSGIYVAVIHFHSLNPAIALKTEENLKVFVKELCVSD
ncbi:MAG: mechanosensitive ion channel domain-containing protein [Rikenellaceae bacterium]